MVNHYTDNDLSIQTIANKNDFHQQTKNLRAILQAQNNEFLKRLEEIMTKKRKRDQDKNDITDDDNDNNHRNNC